MRSTQKRFLSFPVMGAMAIWSNKGGKNGGGGVSEQCQGQSQTGARTSHWGQTGTNRTFLIGHLLWRLTDIVRTRTLTSPLATSCPLLLPRQILASSSRILPGPSSCDKLWNLTPRAAGDLLNASETRERSRILLKVGPPSFLRVVRCLGVRCSRCHLHRRI